MTDYAGSPERANYPFLNQNDKLVVVFRDPPSSGREPILYLRGLTDATYRMLESPDLEERVGLDVIDYTLGATDTITITVNGTAVALLEGADFTAGTSNEDTAYAIAVAINANGTLSPLVTAEVVNTTVYLTPAAALTTLTVVSTDTTAYDARGLFGVPASLVPGGTVQFVLNAPTTHKVLFLFISAGRMAVDVRSAVQFRSYLKQPYELAGNTGDTGNWPVGPVEPD